MPLINTEPTYNNVAERIYHKHDHLIVGRVDCTKYGKICEEYRVDAYPTIIFISKDSRVKYMGDRNEDTIVTFAERLNGPSINLVNTCDQLRGAVEKHRMIVLSTSETNSELKEVFESLAQSYKANYWFYKFTAKPPNKCDNIDLHKESLLVLKRHLDKAIQFHNDNNEESLLKAALKWIGRESFPLYGQINSRNIEQALATGKSVVLAILDEYKPARRLASSSQEFHKSFERLAIRYSQDENYDKLLFGWSSDLELIEYITLTSVKTLPNVIIISSNYSYHLVAQDSTTAAEPSSSTETDKKANIPKELTEHNLIDLISMLKKGELNLLGGDTYTHAILSFTLGNFNKFVRMYRANPLLVSLIFGFPSTVVVFVIYTTCFYDYGSDKSRFCSDDEEDADSEDEDNSEHQRLLSKSHLKQD